MRKNGKVQKLSSEQRRTYLILAVYFKDNPNMLRVAACESSLRHTLPSGEVNVGPDGEDRGVLMVRRSVHERELNKFGLNPDEFAHNIVFAEHLLRRDGYRPWESSRRCWEDLRFLV
jgi:hypothetical protein